MLPFTRCRTIACIQIIQESTDRVVLRTAPADDVSRGPYVEELAVARGILQQILGQDMTIRAEVISPAEYAGSQELRFLISRLPGETGRHHIERGRRRR